MRQHFHRQTCYCPRRPGSLTERSTDNEDIFNSVNSILGAISGVITVFNFVQGRRRKKRSHNNKFALQTCYVPEIPSVLEGLLITACAICRIFPQGPREKIVTYLLAPPVSQNSVELHDWITQHVNVVYGTN